MSQTDLIGWGSLALFAIVFALLYRFITTPSRRLEKTLGDGRALGLWKLPLESPESDLLAEALQPFLGAHGGSFRLGSVYKTDRGSGYLFSMVEISKADRPGGESTQHQDHEKVFWHAPHSFSSFVIRRKPTSGLGIDLSARLLEKIGRGVETAGEGLSPAFQRQFVVYGGATGTPAVPAGLQRLFADAAETAIPSSDGRAAPSGGRTAIDEVDGIAFSPEGFLIHLSPELRSRSREQLRSVIELAERIEQAAAA
jgi:hypothetical protein